VEAEMGTVYFVGCYDCKVYRDIDKFYRLVYEVENREQALDFADEIKADSFRAGLLVSFMGKHMKHNCVVFNERHEGILQHFDPCFDDANEDYDFWNTNLTPVAVDRASPEGKLRDFIKKVISKFWLPKVPPGN